MERDLKILICPGSTAFDSVRLLFRHLEIASGEIGATALSTGLSDPELTDCLKAGCVIIGWDERVFRMRKALGVGCPALLPSYGIGTRGLQTMLEFGDLLTLEDRFFCPSMRDGIAAEVHWGGDSSPFVFLPYAVEIPERIDRSAARARLGVADGEVLIAIIGRINRQKNIDCGLRAVAELAAQGVKVVLLIIGSEDASGFPELGWTNDGCLEDLKRLASELGVDDSVRWMGSLDAAELNRVYAALDWNLTLSTFRTEDFGYVALEAAMHGVPTIGTKWGGLWDTVFDFGIGNRVDIFATRRGWSVDWHRVVDVIVWAQARQDYMQGIRRWLAKATGIHCGLEVFTVRLRSLIRDAALHLEEKPRWLDVGGIDELSPAVRLFWEQLTRRMEGGASMHEARRDALTPDTALPLFSAYFAGGDRRPLTAGSVLYRLGGEGDGHQREALKPFDGRSSLADIAGRTGTDLGTLEAVASGLLDEGLLMVRSEPEFPEI